MKLLLLTITLFFAACQTQEQQLSKKHYFIFGTIVEVLIWHNNIAQVDSALSAIETQLNNMHTQWHAWKQGDLQTINQALRAGKTITITTEQAQFIQTTQKLSQQSLGNFNPAIGELINLWGFHTDNYPITTPLPREVQINEFLAHMPTMQDIVISNKQISSKNPRIWLDFGGIAKGYAIDKAINILKKHGIDNAIVNAGGDLRSIGSKGDKNWKVAIRTPNSEEILAVISVQGDESIFTSGNYQRYKQFNGKRYAHIINPSTGYGVEEIVSATVITDNGTKADAAATALVVAGSRNWQKITKSMQLEQVLLINVQGKCLASKKIIPRLQQIQASCEVLE
ncbi:MAG: FAD:protein FMN transferase [Proteobacteria bacterium]|nr:FAD:protein FMN transferase [Pseudomonadota bacterium]